MEEQIKDILRRRGALHIINDHRFYTEDSMKAALREALIANKNFVQPDVQSLPEAKQDAMKAFIEVCNEPIPEGMGKEYLNAMIKMKAFMAGRCFEYEKKAKGNVLRINDRTDKNR